MSTFDFTPFYRSTVGFDRVFNRLDSLVGQEQKTYPPYNIERVGENAYRISIAVAGFAADELTVEVKEGALHVSARKPAEETPKTYLHRGIATRAFERRFALADHVRVSGATHADGMLHIDLVREVPEALKPRRIEISRNDTVETKALETFNA